MSRLYFDSNKPSGYMEIKNKSPDSAELYFYGDICSDALDKWQFEDVCPRDVNEFLNAVSGVATLDIYVNSGGGSVFGGLAIYNIISRFKGRKIAHVDGIAASIASIIIFACDEITGHPSSQIMIHKPWGMCLGNADEMKKYAETLDTCENSLVEIYKSHAKEGITEDEIREMLSKETWLTLSQATEYFDKIHPEATGSDVAACCKSEYFSKYKNIPDSLKKAPEPTPEPDNSDEIQELQLRSELLRLKFL